MDKEILRQIGLGKNETDVFLTLLKYGEGTVTALSKVCSVHRVNIYDAARNLVKKGMVSELFEDGVSIFKANDPKNILSYLELQKQTVRDILPTLQRSYQAHEDSAQTFYGENGIKHILNDMIEMKCPIYAFGIPKQVPEIIGKFTQTFHRNRIKAKIPIQHIYNEDANERIAYLNKIKFSSAKYLPKELSSPATSIVYGDKVAFWIFAEEIFCVLIKSKTMAVAYKKYFDFLWKLSQ